MSAAKRLHEERWVGDGWESTAGSEPAPTKRDQAKAHRRSRLLDAGAKLIAERGFRGMRLEDLGAAAGVSGPAVYRHFANKEALLVELLTGISDRLRDGGEAIAADSEPAHALIRLVDFHLDFALAEPHLIRIQDRDLDSVPAAARRQIRKAQRQYVEIWVTVLRRNDPRLAEAEARVAAHATFGLINSTPYSAAPTAPTLTRTVLRRMVLSALGVEY